MKLRSRTIAACASCILMALPAAVGATESWEKAQPDVRKIGVEFLVCKDIPEQLVCLGLSCASSSFELISIRSGSGAFTGTVRLSASGRNFDVRFSNHDPVIMDVVGTSGSRARVSAELVEAMTNARKVTIRNPGDDGMTESYLTKGLKALVQDPTGSCAAMKR